ncbi:MAG: thiol reductant ABC exporter subunit CydD, partial [Gammaproteobacteria bacterium]
QPEPVHRVHRKTACSRASPLLQHTALRQLNSKFSMSDPTQAWLKSLKADIRPELNRTSVLGSVAGVVIVVQAWALANIVHGAVFEGLTLADLSAWLVLFPLLVMLRGVLAWWGGRFAFRGALKVKARVRGALHDKIERLGPVGVADERGGSLAGKLVEGVEALDGYFARYLPAAALAGIVPLMILLITVPLDWVSALVFVFTAPLIPVFMILIGNNAQRRSERQWRALARMGGHFFSVLQGLTTLRLFGAGAREGRRIAAISEDFRRRTMDVLRVAFLSSAVLEFFAAISIALVAVFIGFRLLDGEMVFLYGFFVLLLAPELYLPLRELGAQNHARMEAVAAAGELRTFLDRPEPRRAGGKETVFPSGALSLRGLRHEYEPGRRALDGLDLDIPEAARIAIVGPSGAGKSTLAQVILGFVTPQAGEILRGGVSMDAIDADLWQRKVAWVPQRPRLFAGTVAENLSLGLEGIGTDRLRDAARRAQVLDVIESLPRGFDSVIGEGGRALSGGEAQRLAIARVLLRDAPLVVLDEPTAHLDGAAQSAVRSAIDELGRDRTLVVIAHRLETVRTLDRIVVMDRGRVVQSGAWDELATRDGLFRELLLHDGGGMGR